MTYDPLGPENEPFHPPAIPTEVGCLHFQQAYESYLIEWRIEKCSDGMERGFWCCPTPGCSGGGFGFDILPTDPTWRDERGGWICDEDEGIDDEPEFDIDEQVPNEDPPDDDEQLPW